MKRRPEGKRSAFFSTQPPSWDVVGSAQEETEGLDQQRRLGVQAAGAQGETETSTQPERRWAQHQAPYLAVFHHIGEDRCPAATLVPRPPHKLVRVGLGSPG